MELKEQLHVKGMEKLLCKERLKMLRPLTMERRRPRGKWAMVYNILKAVSQVDEE